VVVDGVTGFIRDHPDELPAALARVEEIDPAVCRARVEQHFSAAKLAAGYEAAYRVALSRPLLTAGAVPADPIEALRSELNGFEVGLEWAYDAGRRDATLTAERRDGALKAVPSGPGVGAVGEQGMGGLAVTGGG
jgi:hypothetical protein